MTADAQARGVEEEAAKAADRILNEKCNPIKYLFCPSKEIVEAVVCAYLAGYRAAEEKAAKVTRAAVVEELKRCAVRVCAVFEGKFGPCGNECPCLPIHARIATLEAQDAEPETGGER